MITKDTTFVIVGLGLLGGSYAMGLKEAGYQVLGVARRQETIDYALEHGLIDEGTLDPEKFLPRADIVVFALYPTIMIHWIQEHQHAFHPRTLLTDVSGVKVNVADKVQSFLREDVEFIAAHPMAGRETSGIEYANTEMFKDANYIIVPTEKNTEEAVETSRQLANILHFHHIATLSMKEHDEMIGFLSQLTHVIAVSLMNTHDNSHLVEYTGDSFRDLTRIAKINETMWSELFLLNKKILLSEIDAFAKELKHFRNTLAAEDTEEMKRLFIQSTNRRKKFDKLK
ncbi:prephenate dehydrogenase [Merdibacter massiliensis]|uniref:prephenate dehydrogenase n=1 Tax=Merdibacter massiliensis TaxID=1871030 RepID=UPI00096A6841|nr:prephenate dehydrogenase/arogenate dehydrogenase family protein [Merdibacter massiliensis]